MHMRWCLGNSSASSNSLENVSVNCGCFLLST